MEKKIEEAVCRYGMERIYDGAIVGFSGGADSSALLHYLVGKCSKLLAVHINHMIRGAEALRDEESCKHACKQYGVKLITYSVDIPALSRERKKGLEETAREERYRIFNEILRDNQEYKCIVTAHNANDNAETVVFNLARGSGAKGLCGIQPVHGNIYRPLINSTREEIIKYCVDNNIEYVTDSTNSDTDYTRNRIRHNVIPELLKVNSGFFDSCLRLGEILRQDEEYISKEASKLIDPSSGRLYRNAIAGAARALTVRALRSISPVALDYRGVQACMALVENWSTGKMVNLSSGVTFKVEHEYCSFITTGETVSGAFYSQLEQGVNFIEGTDIAVLVGDGCAPTGYCESAQVRLNSKEVELPLYVRSKQDGDTVKSGGITKKLKRVLADLHIPSHERKKLPVICDSKGVLTVPGIIARDGAFNKKGDLNIKIYIKDDYGGINEEKE